MTTMKKLSKRSLALFLVLVMCLGMMQLTAFADETESSSVSAPTGDVTTDTSAAGEDTSQPEETPEQQPEEDPVGDPEQKPAENPEGNPEENPEQNPEENPEQKPEENPEENPEQKPEENPEENPEQKPEENPEENPEQKPEENPEENPEQKPEENPEQKPVENPEENPEQKPVENPEENPEQKPVENPEPKPEEKPAEPETPEAIQAFLDAVAAIPEEITEENLEAASAAVDNAWTAWNGMSEFYDYTNNVWVLGSHHDAVMAMYGIFYSADQTVKGLQLAGYPFTGEWSTDEAGNRVLTICGEGTYTGSFALVENGSRLSIETLSSLQDQTTPFAVKLEGATAIGNNAFNTCKQLTQVDLGNVSTIGDRAFSGCTALAGIDLEQVTDIGASAFYGAFDASANVEITLKDASVGALAFYKSKINTLNAAGLTAIGNQAFLGSTLTTAEISIVDGAELAEAFFYSCPQLTDVTVTGDLLVKNVFRNCSKLSNVTLNQVTEVGVNAFQDCVSLTSIVLPDSVTNIDTRGFFNAGLTTVNIPAGLVNVGYEAFKDAKLTGSYDLSQVEYVAFNAFTGCSGIASITVGSNTALEHSDIFQNVLSGFEDRVVSILAGTFRLDSAAAISTLQPDGWTSSRTGDNNDAVNYGGTQLTKEARWSNSSNTTADVQLKAYYSDNAQMDFVFVLDLSNSMNKVGNPGTDKNARLYDMQSKLLDVTNELMTTPGYDCHVAFTGFGETSSLTSGAFFESASEAANFIKNDLKTFYENTNYSLGLGEALTLVNGNSGRNTTVVFISDGQPYAGGSAATPSSYYGYAQAQQLKDTGAEIYAVLQSVPEGELSTAQQVMETICTDGKFFTASQTSEFSKAVNNAISCGFTTYTLVDVVGPEFALNRNSIRASAGTVEISTDSSGNTVITWTINGMPFTTHTLSFRETLQQVDGAYPAGAFQTNAGSAELRLGDTTVNTVASPELSRTNSSTDGGGSTSDPDTDSDPGSDPDPDTPVVNLPDEESPRAEEPVIEIPEEEVPLEKLPEEEILEEEVPLADAPKTGDSRRTALWTGLCGISLFGMIALLGKKREDKDA